MKLPEENIGEMLQDIVMGNDLLKKILKAQGMQVKIGK
jgi:hypothetical protein